MLSVSMATVYCSLLFVYVLYINAAFQGSYADVSDFQKLRLAYCLDPNLKFSVNMFKALSMSS